MKKVLRVSIYIIVGLLLFLVIAVPIYINYWRNTATVPTFTVFSEPEEISFSEIRWDSDILGNEKIEKTALFVPVKLKGLTGNLYMQFDSGTQTTLFYGKTLNQLIQKKTPVTTF